MNSEANEREAGREGPNSADGARPTTDGARSKTDGARRGAEGDSRASADVATDSGYVHRPDEATARVPNATGPVRGEGMGRRGWVLVGAVVLCTLVIPSLIYLRPSVPTQTGWGFFATMLVLPMFPAVLLGLIAVWSMKAGGTDRER